MSGNGNEDLRGILLEQVERLLADNVTPDLLRGLEKGAWPAALWGEVEALGLPLALAPEEMGGAGLGWDDAVAVWQVLGRHGAPVPLAESMAAAGILAVAGIAPPAGLLALPVRTEQGMPWGRQAAHLVRAWGDTVALHKPAGTREGRDTVSRLPSDILVTEGAAQASAAMPPSLGPDAAPLAGALVHAALIAGALEAAGRSAASRRCSSSWRRQRARWRRPASPRRMPRARRRGAGWRGRSSRSPRPRSSPARRPGASRRSPTRCTPRWALPTSMRCTSSPAASGPGATQAAPNGSGRGASAGRRWHVAAPRFGPT